MNAFWKHKLKYSKHLHFPELKQPVKDIAELTSGIIGKNRESPINIGRAWKVFEVRLKSDSDLHKLWHVLLKEKLALKSDLYYISQKKNIENFNEVDRSFNKVQKSMNIVKSVIAERRVLRNEMMNFLEFYYIKKKQKNPNYKIATYVPTLEATTEEQQTTRSKEHMTIEQSQKKKKVIIKGSLISEKSKTSNTIDTVDKEEVSDTLKNEIVEKKKEDDSVSVLTEVEQKIAKKLTKKYRNSHEKLADYIENSYLLFGKEKRRIKSMIDMTRAKQAKEIFSKEMAAISYKLKNTKQSKDPNMNKLENLS